MNIVLIGMKHCGKTTVGKDLAARRGWPFYDVDNLIEAAYTEETGDQMSIRGIYREHGEETFNRMECLAVRRFHENQGERKGPHVLALAGRTPLNEDLPDIIGQLGLMVYLDLAPERMFDRVVRGGLPPFLNKDNPLDDFLRLYRERKPVYERVADLKVTLDDLTPAKAVDLIEQRIEEHQRGGQ